MVASATVLFVTLCGAVSVRAADYPELKVEKLLVSSSAYNGQPLAYLEGKHPEVTAMTVTIPPGGETGWHRHPVPVYAYVMEGELTVELKNERKYRFTKGEVILEVRETPHNGRNTGTDPTKLLVFYTGSSGIPNVIREVP